MASDKDAFQFSKIAYQVASGRNVDSKDIQGLSKRERIALKAVLDKPALKESLSRANSSPMGGGWW